MSQTVQYVLSLRDLLSDKIKMADGSVNRLEGSIGRAQSAVVSFGSAVGIAFGAAAIVGFASKMVSAGTTVENQLTGLTTLLKDQAEAQQVVNNTMEDATKTPFAFEGLLSANKALIAAGVGAKDARADVLNLANAIAATGGGDDELQRMVVNLQQIKNTGKATAMDIKQFAFAGVNIYKLLAEATNQPIEKVKDMEVSYDTLTMALRKAHDEGGIYFNGLENMSKNTSVRISNLGDSVFNLSVQMFNDLKPAIDTVINGIAKFVEKMAEGWNWVMRNKEEIKNFALVLGAIVAPLAIVTAGTWLLTAAGGALTLVLTGVATVMTFIAANPITVALMAVAGAVMYCYTHFAKFRAVLWGVWETVKEFASLVKEAFQNLWHIIHGIFTLDADEIKLGSVSHANAMMNAGHRLGKAFKKGYDDGMKDFAEEQKANTVAAPKNVTKAAGAVGAKNPNIEPTKETKGATGQKNTTINVTIGSLIKDFKIETTNITEGAGKVREMVAQALLSATNDSQILAGQ